MLYFGVAIICRAGLPGAAKYVTIPARKAVSEADLQAGLSVILFNPVKHLAVPRRKIREQWGL
jgi:hypothetical protein